MVTWNWNEENDSEGLVHQSVTNTDHNDATALKQGYDYANFSEITPTPVSCYPLHEDSGTTANDLSGTNDGTSSGGVSWGETGLLGTTAVGLDATDDQIEVPNASALNPTTITVSMWLNIPSGEADTRPLLKSGTSPVATYNYFITNNSKMRFQIHNGSFQDVTSTVAVDTATWTHFVGTYDGSAVRLYIDGTEDASLTGLSGDITTTDGSLFIGSEGGARYSGATVADTRIIGQSITATQVQTLYDVVVS